MMCLLDGVTQSTHKILEPLVILPNSLSNLLLNILQFHDALLFQLKLLKLLAPHYTLVGLRREDIQVIRYLLLLPLAYNTREHTVSYR